jgi:gluconate 2-dehydrogenase gamma chain
LVKSLNRREILERMAVVSGGAISLIVLSACEGGASVPKDTKNIKLKVLSRENLDLIADFADMIIPDTDTLGAKSVNVHYFIDELAANWMTKVERDCFIERINSLDRSIKTKHGNTFSFLSRDKKIAILDSLGLEIAKISSDNTNKNRPKHIYLELRELIIFSYYTSEVGASEELLYDPMPGNYKGCVAFSDVGKTWSI